MKFTHELSAEYSSLPVASAAIKDFIKGGKAYDDGKHVFLIAFGSRCVSD